MIFRYYFYINRTTPSMITGAETYTGIITFNSTNNFPGVAQKRDTRKE